MTYKPRTQSKKFLDGDCPSGVLAIYDNGGKTFDRYTVFYKPEDATSFADTWIGHRDMSAHPSSPGGYGIYGEMEAYNVAAYRNGNYRESATWSSLPDDVKEAVRYDCR